MADPDQPTHVAKSGNPPEKRAWLRWTSLALAAVATVFALWIYEYRNAWRELQSAHAAFGERGLPMRLDEILPPAVPETDNADPLLRAAWEIATGSKDWDKSFVDPAFDALVELDLFSRENGSVRPRIDRDAVARAEMLFRTSAVDAFLRTIHSALQRKTWHQDLNYADGLGLLMPHIRPARTMSQLLSKRAIVFADQSQDMAAAWADVVAAWKLAEGTEQAPLLIALLTGTAIRGLIQPTAVHLLETAPPPPSFADATASLRVVVENLPARFLHAVQTERLVMFSTAERILLAESDWLSGAVRWIETPRWVDWCDPWLTPILSRVWKPRLYGEIAELYRRQLDLELATKEFNHNALARLKTLEERTRSKNEVLVSILFPVYSNLARAFLLHITNQRALLAAMYCAQYRQQTGSVPTTLDELDLPSDLLTDICSGQPLVYVRQAHTIRIYGFGIDGDDDGGRAIQPMSSDDDGDIVIELAWPHVDTERTPDIDADF